MMLDKRLVVRLLVGLVLISGAWSVHELTAGEKDEKRGGTIIGTLTGKGDNYIEVKADGEEKGRKFVPHWRGGLPAQGGGLDKEMVKVIQGLKVGSRVRVDWEFVERPRVVRVQVLKAAEGKANVREEHEDEDETKKRKLIGTLTGKGKEYVEVRADGEEKSRQYYLHFGGTKELLRAMETTPIGSRVQIEWIFVERPRVLSMQPIAKSLPR